MKNFFILSITAIVTVAVAPPSVQAKGSRSYSTYKSYSYAPREHAVSGYSRKDGAYVAPYDRTNRDETRNNNWTTEGNINPHTGKKGTIPRDRYEKNK